MPFPFLAIGAGLAALNAGSRWFSGNKQTKLANKINPVFNPYKASPYAGQRLGLANQMFNSRMAGAPQMERNIFSNQANYQGAVERSATDSSSALAAASAGQGQTNEALSNLLTAEEQNKYAMLQNLNNAYQGMVIEGDKEFDSMKYKFEQDMAQKNALMESGMSNKYGAISDLAGASILISGLPGKVGAKKPSIATNRTGIVNRVQTPITQRTTINRPQVGTQRPVPVFRTNINYLRR